MSWNRFKECYFEFPELEFSIDVSRIKFSSQFLEEKQRDIEILLMPFLNNSGVRNTLREKSATMIMDLRNIDKRDIGK